MTTPSSAQCQLVGATHGFGPATFPDAEYDLQTQASEENLVLGGGCFWCVEAVFKQLRGVSKVVSGYAGGEADTANYAAVCGGHTAHAEVVQVHYNPQRISYAQLLKVFFSVAHDATQWNRQGNDRGPQYRSVIFTADEAEHEVAARYIAQLNASNLFNAPIVTTLEPLKAFYPAEPEHQNYAELNPGQPYIQAISTPKVDKLRKSFSAELG